MIKPYYFRIDRIKQITEHRCNFSFDETPNFDEGLLRQRSLFMWPGGLRTIRFEFNGPSVQAVLDKLPTAKIIERLGGRKYLIEAETYGDGIKMWLLSQGAWGKAVSPPEFVDLMKNEVTSIHKTQNAEKTTVNYALSKEKENRMHDDRFYVLIMLAHRLYEIRRGTIVNKPRVEESFDFFLARPAKKYS